MAAHSRQADVQEHDLWVECLGGFEGRRAVMSDDDVLPVQQCQDLRQAPGGVDIVVHDQYATAKEAGEPGSREPFDRGEDVLYTGQTWMISRRLLVIRQMIHAMIHRTAFRTSTNQHSRVPFPCPVTAHRPGTAERDPCKCQSFHSRFVAMTRSLNSSSDDGRARREAASSVYLEPFRI